MAQLTRYLCIEGCELTIAVIGLIRNPKVADLICELKSFGLDVHVHDPIANAEEAEREYGLKLESWEGLAQGKRDSTCGGTYGPGRTICGPVRRKAIRGRLYY